MSNDSIMVRLRRANPVPETPAAGNNDLFDRITALPQEAPVGERREGPTRRQRRGLVLVLAAVIAALLASTAFAISQWLGGDVVEPPVTRQEYFDAQKQLVLPPGVRLAEARRRSRRQLRDDPRRRRRPGGPHRDERVGVLLGGRDPSRATPRRGSEHTTNSTASSRPTCSRLRRAPRRTGCPRLFPTVPFATFAHDGGLDWIREGYDRAAAGHPGRVAQSCRANAQDTVPGQ